MMKKIFVFITLLFLGFMEVKAVDVTYYYETDDGGYALCGSQPNGCLEVEKNTDGLTYNSKINQIYYNGYTYSYNETKQEEYYVSQYGKTRMYYYINSSGNYVLCTKVGSCTIYTREKLENLGAIISNNSTITLSSLEGPGAAATIYYYNASLDSTDGSSDGDGSSSGDCAKLKAPLKFLGNIVLIAKIGIPIILIIYGAVDFFRVIIGSKDDEIKKAARTFLFRLISGVVIFLIPTVVSVIFSLISDFANMKGDFNACQKCILNVSQCE